MKHKIWTKAFFLLMPTLALAAQDTNEYKPTSVVKQYEGYTLIWQDEFDKDGRPDERWDYEQGFVRNNELQWYQADNASVKDGVLVIEGRREVVNNPYYEEGAHDWRRARQQAEYTSASLTTRKSFHFKYGRVEVRAKIPTASGSWPAIWLLGNQWGWPSCGEVDMMEYYIAKGIPSILANACWRGERDNSPVWDSVVAPLTHFTDSDANWAEKFHVWRMDWDEMFIQLYLDDELMNTIDLSKTINRGGRARGENPFSNDVEDFGMYILLNLALGENGGTPDDSRFPLKYCVDYVRVYSPSATTNAASASDGHAAGLR